MDAKSFQDILHALNLPGDFMLVVLSFALVFTRLIIFVGLAPFLGGNILPAEAKIGLSGAFFVVLFPMLKAGLPAQAPRDLLFILGLFMKEALLGLIMGFSVSLVFYAIESAGGIIDNQRGVAQAALLSPVLGTQASLFGGLQFQLALVLFVSLGGHLRAIEALFGSFASFPLFDMPPYRPGITPLLDQILRWTGDLLLIALQLSAPALIAIFLSDIILGLANRIAPQMDVFFLSFTVKMYLGVLLTFLALPYLAYMLKVHLSQMLGHMRYILSNFL